MSATRQGRLDLDVPRIRFASLGSGSRGNGTLLDMNGQLLLVDCGFTVKDACARLGRLGVDPGDLDAVLVTHEHSDHVSGVAPLARRYGAPVYMSYGTARQLRDLRGFDLRPFDSHAEFAIGTVAVKPVSVPHDAREPTQFVMESTGKGGCRRVGVLTDLGHVTRHVVERYRGCHGLLMESNHDLDMLWSGRYPPALKRRIAGSLGHLANAQALEFLGAILHDDLQQVVIGHISAENNCAALIRDLYRDIGRSVSCLAFADQERGSGWATII